MPTARVVLRRLSQGFAFSTSEPMELAEGSGGCSFRVAYGAGHTIRTMTALLAAIPGTRVSVQTPDNRKT